MILIALIYRLRGKKKIDDYSTREHKLDMRVRTIHTGLKI